MKLFIALSVTLLIHGFSYASTGAHGVFRVVKGQVSITSAQNGQVSRARVGTKVLPGDIISTKKDSRAKVVMVDNNEINISPDSEIKIEKYEFDPNKDKKDVLLNVIYGKVRSKVEQKYDGKTSKFQVKTPAAVAGVRGTDFITGYTASTGVSQVITFEGRVDFGTLGPNGQILNPIPVTPGQMMEIGKDSSATIPQEVPQENLKQMDNESNAETADSSASSAPASSQPVAATTQEESSPSAESKDTTPAPQSQDSKPAPNSRQPSSTAGMIQSGDLPSSPNGGPGMSSPPVVAPPMIPNLSESGANQAIRDIIQNGNTNLRITVQQ